MQNKKIAELLHEYFELGVAEGREGRNHDTEAGDAQRVLSAIEAEIAALPAPPAVKPYGYVYESTVRYCDGRGPHRKVDFFHTKKNISDDDIEEFEITETAVYSAQVREAAGVEAINALKEAEPYVEICHSLMTQKETRTNVWRVLKRVRAAIAGAPATQEG